MNAQPERIRAAMTEALAAMADVRKLAADNHAQAREVAAQVAEYHAALDAYGIPSFDDLDQRGRRRSWCNGAHCVCTHDSPCDHGWIELPPMPAASSLARVAPCPQCRPHAAASYEAKLLAGSTPRRSP